MPSRRRMASPARLSLADAIARGAPMRAAAIPHDRTTLLAGVITRRTGRRSAVIAHRPTAMLAAVSRAPTLTGAVARGASTRADVMVHPRPMMHAPVARCLAPILAGVIALTLLACDEARVRPAWTPAASSTLALAPDEATLWLASPDDGRVVQIAADDLTALAWAEVGDAPAGVAWVTWDGTDNGTVDGTVDGTADLTDRLPPGRALAVALAQGHHALFLTPDGIRRVPVPCGGLGVVVALGDAALFACPHDDRLVEVTPAGQLRRVIAAPGRPTALAVLPDAIAVTASRTGRVRTLARADYEAIPLAAGPIATANDAAIPPVADPITPRWHTDRALEATPGFAATRVDALAPGPRGPLTAYQRVDHDSDRDRPPATGGYGRVVDDAPRIDPRVDGCGPRYARFDGGARVFAGPSALAYAPATGHLWIAHEFTDNVAVLDCAPADSTAPSATEPPTTDPTTPGPVPLPPLLAHHHTGRGPRGIALSSDGRTAWIDLALDHAIARLTLPAEATAAPIEATLTRTRPTGPIPYTPAALRGRRLFHDATDPHLTPSGVVACATCHPGGGEDGLSWFLHHDTIPRKLRRTPPAHGARAALAPYHWDGEFDDIATLTHATIRALMDGDALLIDADAVAAYLDQLTPPPGRPAFDAADAALIARGEATFTAAGCAECHPPPLYADARSYAVLAPAADPDARLAAADTPSLRAVRARPPYLHDGRAATLLDVITTHNPDDRHGMTRHLSAPDLAALVRYLESL